MRGCGQNLCDTKKRSYRANSELYSGEPSFDELIKVTGGFLVLFPSKLNLQFPFDPLFCFGKNPEPIDGFEAALIHDLVTPEKFIYKNIPVVYADSLLEVFNGMIGEHVANFHAVLF
jgi:hypothetical protein